MKYITLILICLFMSCNAQDKNSKKEAFIVEKTEEEWKTILSPEAYHVLRESGTERPFTGKYNMHFEKGIYTCGACGTPLFSSDNKFKTHCGWAGFDDEVEGAVFKKIDNSHGMKRIEILCANCGSHLGHVFNDGPTPTGLRYCVNSLSLNFEPTSEETQK